MLFTVAIRLYSVLRMNGSTWCRFTLTFIHGESFRKYQWPTGRAVQTCLSSGSLTDYSFEKHLQPLHFPSFSGPSFPYQGEVHPADLDTQLILKGSQGRVGVVGPITPGRASQAILAPKTKRHLMRYGNQLVYGAFGIFQFIG